MNSKNRKPPSTFHHSIHTNQAKLHKYSNLFLFSDFSDFSITFLNEKEIAKQWIVEWHKKREICMCKLSFWIFE